MDCPLPTIHFFMWKFYQVFMLCINIFSYQVFSNLSPLCSVLVSISPCSAALTNKPWNSGAQPSYRTLISQSDVSQAALLQQWLRDSSWFHLSTLHLRTVSFQWWGGERSGEYTPTLNCLRMEATHHFHSHSPWGELNRKVPNDLQGSLGNIGKHVDIWSALLCYRLPQQGWLPSLPGTTWVLALTSLASRKTLSPRQTEKVGHPSTSPWLVSLYNHVILVCFHFI